MHTNSPNTLDEWLTYLQRLHPTEIELGLTRINKVAEDLKLISFDGKVITVAGTNGKGTTCAFLEEILVRAGYKVGVYSSPHIQRYTERLRINHNELTEQVHCDAFSIIEVARKETSLSYFEYATLACLYLLKEAQCDFILLEVGLGGRLDATNIVESDISVVTTIAIDHVDWLGDDREKIGFEKAGVFRANKPVICGELDPPKSLQAYANQLHADIRYSGKDFTYQIEGNKWQWQGKQLIDNINLPLLPIQNAATALATIEALQLNLAPSLLKSAVENASLAGRLQKIDAASPCAVYLDVAHNPQSAHYLASQLTRIKTAKGSNCKVHAIIGMLQDKDISGTFSEISPQLDYVNFVTLDCYRGANAQQLLDQYTSSQNIIKNKDVIHKDLMHCFKNVEEAYKMTIDKVVPSDIIIIFGSFYTVSDFLTFTQG